ncbi:MAG: cation diffusion facilitator family transporter [Bacteroidetes bacterium]|nr:cation diffusion facilitator family transporter [Bacteroidota bacterium]MBU1115549.1 cation diffusion facilitator family transporter [Bacteroidota bacterium]MBU1797705.1 cation diffusion facilitator family transporter [Bacteroidota bacterium]
MSQSNSHTHEVKDFGKAFAIGIALNVVYIVIEVIYGLIVNSLALIADAGHNLSDVLGLIIAWVASYLVKKSATKKYTYGLKKSSVLAAFINAMILLVAIGIIIWEAIGRFAEPQQIEGTIIMIVAGIGVFINAVTALLFFSGRKHDLNIKGAFLHMAADAGISLGVVIVGLVLTFTNLYWLDPVMSIVIALIIFWGTWDLLKDSTSLALDAVPKEIDKDGVENYFDSMPQLKSFHDLHIWAMSTTETALTVHAVVEDGCSNNELIDKISEDMRHQFNIVHTTIQFETKGDKVCNQNHI